MPAGSDRPPDVVGPRPADRREGHRHVGMQHCAVTDDGVHCALESTCVRWGAATTCLPQAGIGVFERGPDGLLTAHVYDDIEAPVGRP
jgi:hypothetical protein